MEVAVVCMRKWRARTKLLSQINAKNATLLSLFGILLKSSVWFWMCDSCTSVFYWTSVVFSCTETFWGCIIRCWLSLIIVRKLLGSFSVSGRSQNHHTEVSLCTGLFFHTVASSRWLTFWDVRAWAASNTSYPLLDFWKKKKMKRKQEVQEELLSLATTRTA